MHRLNPLVPAEYLEQALAEIVAPQSQDAIAENYRLHQILVHGYRGSATSTRTASSRTPHPAASATGRGQRVARGQPGDRPVEGRLQRRFDVVLYLNGMPVVIVELKKAGAEHADHRHGARPAATYLREFPMAFRFCVFTIVSDGITARYGTPFTPLNHFSPWNVDDDGASRQARRSTWPTTGSASSWSTCIDGLCNPERFLQLPRNFTAFDEDSDGLAKRIAKPHQYFAVTKAVGTHGRRRSRATARPASSGTRRARASRWRWSSTPTSWRGSPS